MLKLNMALDWIVVLYFVILLIAILYILVVVICIRKRRDLFIFVSLTLYTIVCTIGIPYYSQNIFDPNRYVKNW